MADLFEQREPLRPDTRKNLAARMRPRSLDEFAGQSHLLAPGKLLHRLITSNRFSALLFFGPPGTGKTSLAFLIATVSGERFVALNAVEASVSDLRKAVQDAEAHWQTLGKRTILLVDEIHRFNKAQQDALLPHVEHGTVRLVGATTHNPFFYVNPALISRMQVFEFLPLAVEDVLPVLRRALADAERGLGAFKVVADDDALRHLAKVCDGDVRKSLNALEVGVLSTPAGADTDGAVRFTLTVAQESIQRKAVVYDKDEDAHYDTISAFIKCVRGSEPDAAVYLLAKMLHAGEDIRFIARRLVISAAEDIGLADPRALSLAVACQQAVEFIGLPEARIPLAETTIYLATAPKSNAAYLAGEAAAAAIKEGRTLEVPNNLKNATYDGEKALGRHVGYQYAHDYADGVADEKMFAAVSEFYQPTNRGYEKLIAERLARWNEIRRQRQAAQTK
ncbi:MAG: replication-associated recombination protein A [Verrucomicrobiales bacterium]|jgi:putative ATPase|nr:replication-associated recombination protein A [Verrucomicrobiales bacterium]